MKIITYDQVKSKIIKLRNQKVILDYNVAELYGVQTREVNQAIKRNPDKFPSGYLIYLDSDDWDSLKSQNAILFDGAESGLYTDSSSISQIVISTEKGGRIRSPIAFTERGLYMLATILKSSKAIETSIAIIDTFAQVRDLANSIQKISKTSDNIQKIKLLDGCANIVTELLDNELIISQQETNVKIKLPFFELSKKTTKIKK